MKVTREFKVGLIFVISVVILYWGVNYLKGTDIFSSQRIIYGVYNNTNGLSGGRPVTLNGKQVGQVKAIEFADDLSGNLVVAMNLTTEYPIPANSRAIITGDLLGNKQVDLIMGNSQEIIQNGDTIATEVRKSLTETVNQQIAPLKNKAEKLLGSLDTAITVIQGFLTPETQKDFKSTFTNLSSTFEHLNNISENADLYMADNLERLSRITTNLDDITTTLSANRGQLENVFSNLNALSDTLARARVGETMAQLALASKQANEIMTRINRGEGSAGKLINDEELYDNLSKASESLDRLLLDLRYNPNRYVEFSIFGSRTRYTQEEIDALEEERLKKGNEN